MSLNSQPGNVDSQPGNVDSQPGNVDSQPGNVDKEPSEDGLNDLILPEDMRENPFFKPAKKAECEDKEKQDNDVSGNDKEDVEEKEQPYDGNADEDQEAEDAEEAEEAEAAEEGEKDQEGENQEGEPEIGIEDEIELWELCNREELFSLLRDDPERLIPIFEDRKELAQKYDCLVRRDEGNLRIKFKIHPDDRWTEVGYFEEFDDSAVYEEFSCVIQRLLERSRSFKDPKQMSRKEFLESQENRENAHIGGEVGNSSKPRFESAKDTMHRLKKEAGEEMEMGDDKEPLQEPAVTSMNLKIQQDREDKIRPLIRKKTAEEQKKEERRERKEQRKEQRKQREQKKRDRLLTDHDIFNYGVSDEDEDSETDAEAYAYDPCNQLASDQDYDSIYSDSESENSTLGSMEIDCSVAGLLTAYLDQLMEKMSLLVPEWLERDQEELNGHGRDTCGRGRLGFSGSCAGVGLLTQRLERFRSSTPSHLLKPFQDLLGKLKMAPSNEYYLQMANEKNHSIPPLLHPIYDQFLNQILEGESQLLGKQFPHSRICRLLGLKRSDIDLLREHGVDLRRYWNSYIQD